MKNKAAKQKSKRKSDVVAFGCDLTEHLQNSGKDVPQVLKSCTEFIEKHGIVDGIYRLSGITSNIQRLRQEFCTEASPELTKEIYLQDIHCVGSLCKLYFRELPNPLLTFELYRKFMDAVSVEEEHVQLNHIQNVINELPPPHYRTLEYLVKHLVYMATFSSQTNMHARNLALVWAPNLLRSEETELHTCDGDTAFLEVRVQQKLVEFILNHVEQIFNGGVLSSLQAEGLDMCATIPTSSQSTSMKLMSLEEAQARSIDQRHPAHRDPQWESSAPDSSIAALYHTTIDLPDSRMFAGKSKKWKSIFNLGRSVTDSKGKQSRSANDVFVKAQTISERDPSPMRKSMDMGSFSMEDTAHEVKESSGGKDSFMPVFKSCTLGSSGTIYKLNEKDHEFGVTKGSPCTGRAVRKGGTSPLHKALPEQMKVFKGDDSNCQPTSPVNGRMLYTSSTSSNSSKLAFPGSLFPPESSPRHCHKVLNISDPFAVSVPLRVSAVINSNSTPCRAQDQDEAAFLLQKSSMKASVAQQDCNGRNRSVCSNASFLNNITFGQDDFQATAKTTRSGTGLEPTKGHDTEQKVCIDTVLHSEEELNELSGPLSPPHLHFKQPASTTTSGDPETELSTLTPIQLWAPHTAQSSMPSTKLQNQFKHHQLEELTQDEKCLVEEKGPGTNLQLVPNTMEPDKGKTEPTNKAGELTKTAGNHGEQKCMEAIFSGETNDLRNIVVVKPIGERQKSLDLPDKVDENTWQSNSEDSEQVEPWEDCSTTKQWVTSPLHSLKTFDFLLKSEELTLCLMGDSNKGTFIVDSFNTGMIVPSLIEDVHKCPNLKRQSVGNLQNQENRGEIFEEARSVGRLAETLEQKSNSFLRPKNLKSGDTLYFEKVKETTHLTHKRPHSLNLDQGMSHTKKLGQDAFTDIFFNKRASIAIVETKYNHSYLDQEIFLSDCQTAKRRNSAPISVSSIRTSFIVKTCQAKSVPVVAPKIQYCQIPEAHQLKKLESSKENEQENLSAGSRIGVLNSQPASHRHGRTSNSFEMCKATLPTDEPVLRWKPDSKAEASKNSARFDKSTTQQRQTLRTRPNRPQSLILFSALFPFTDHLPLGDNDKVPLSSIKNNSETTASQCAFNKEADGVVKNPEVVTQHSKLTMPKSGQRLETSMNCFYQPHRRSMISDSKSNLAD